MLLFFDLCLRLRNGLILTCPSVFLKVALIFSIHGTRLSSNMLNMLKIHIFMHFIMQFSLPFAIFCSLGVHILNPLHQETW